MTDRIEQYKQQIADMKSAIAREANRLAEAKAGLEEIKNIINDEREEKTMRNIHYACKIEDRHTWEIIIQPHFLSFDACVRWLKKHTKWVGSSIADCLFEVVPWYTDTYEGLPKWADYVKEEERV